MKKKITNITSVLTFVFILGFSTVAMAQAPPPPPPGGSNSSGNQLGGNAPIGGGLFILLGLGAVYGGRKMYKLKKESLEE